MISYCERPGRHVKQRVPTFRGCDGEPPESLGASVKAGFYPMNASSSLRYPYVDLRDIM